MRTYAVFYPQARRPGLLKDVGQLAWHMSRRDGWRATIVTHPNSPSYDTIPIDDRFTIEIIPPSRHVLGVSIGGLVWIWHNASNVEVVQLFHLRFQTFVYAALFRLRNPSSVLYMKTDLNTQQFAEKRPKRYSPGTLVGMTSRAAFTFFLDRLAPLGLRLFDLLSGETRASVSWLRTQFPSIAANISHVPNGLAPFPAPGPAQEKRERLILTVARLGTWEKNSEMLVDAAAAIRLTDWKIVFCGPVEPGFREYAESRLGESAVFTGPIDDREELYDLYRRARCFCLPSRFESFAFVLLEAYACGDYILSTDVGVAADLLGDPRDGRLVTDTDSLVAALREVVETDVTLHVRIAERRVEVERLYDWKRITAALEQRIEKAVGAAGSVSRVS